MNVSLSVLGTDAENIQPLSVNCLQGCLHGAPLCPAKRPAGGRVGPAISPEELEIKYLEHRKPDRSTRKDLGTHLENFPQDKMNGTTKETPQLRERDA